MLRVEATARGGVQLCRHTVQSEEVEWLGVVGIVNYLPLAGRLIVLPAEKNRVVAQCVQEPLVAGPR